MVWIIHRWIIESILAAGIALPETAPSNSELLEIPLPSLYRSPSKGHFLSVHGPRPHRPVPLILLLLFASILFPLPVEPADSESVSSFANIRTKDLK